MENKHWGLIMQLAGINIYLDYVSRYSKTRRIKKRLFKNFIALDVYLSANHIVGNYCKRDKSDRLKKKKLRIL